MTERFIIVDDDPMHIEICKYIIENSGTDYEIKSYQYPAEALEVIAQEYSDAQSTQKTVLLLDLNMPVIDGWEFLEQFSSFHPDIHQQFSIFLLTSSISPMDIRKAESNSMIKKFLSKPFLFEDIQIDTL